MDPTIKHPSAQLIIAECNRQNLPRTHIAYVLATAWHETGQFKYMREIWGPTLAQKRYEGRKNLGNTVKGDGKRFMGRGFVQITGRANYAKWSHLLNLDLLANPADAEKPAIAVRIIVGGMKAGTFTGKKLADYLSINGGDFKNARRIVNGVDKAATIAGYAKKFLALLVAQVKVETSGLAQPAKPAADNAVLKLGDKGKYVADLKAHLAALGYGTNSSDEFDAATEREVRRFQRQHGLLEDGRAGLRTNTAIGEALKTAETRPAMDAARNAVEPVAEQAVSPGEILTGVTAVGGAATTVKTTVEAVNEGAQSLWSLGPWILAGLLGVGLALYVFRDLRAKKAAAVKASAALKS